MRCYQVLSGACNTSNKCSAVGSVEGVPFSAYGSGSNIVILAVSFERVQIIPSLADTPVDCLDCSSDTGIIAAAYGRNVVVYEPSPLPQQNSPHKLDYWWVEKCSFDVGFPVHSIEFNQDGTRMLIGGEQIQLWRYKTVHQDVPRFEPHKKKKVSFDVGDESNESDDSDYPESLEVSQEWVCIWKSCKFDSPIFLLAFSADGSYFASCEDDDNLVRVWFEDLCLNFVVDGDDHSAKTHSQRCQLSHSYVLLAHPMPVTSLAWRATSKYMPRGSVGNILVTSCKDNVCRVWSETLLPDDGISSASTFGFPDSQPRSRSQRQKKKLLERLKHLRSCVQIRQDEGFDEDGDEERFVKTLPTLVSSYSISDAQLPGVDAFTSRSKHFHLSASINAETDIPLTPSFSASELESEMFVLHWLNNKEMYFTMRTEQLLQEFAGQLDLDVESDTSTANAVPVSSPQTELGATKKSMRATTGDLSKFVKTHQKQDDIFGEIGLDTPTQSQISSSSVSLASTPCVPAQSKPVLDAFDRKIEALLQEWHTGSDLLFAVHPSDGSLLVWTLDYLDEHQPGIFRQPLVSFSSRLPSAIPKGDAATLSPSIALYNACHKFDVSQVVENMKQRKSPVKFSVREEDEEGSDSGSEVEKPTVTKFSRRISIIEDESTTKAVSEDYLTSEDPFTPGPSPIISMVTRHTNGTMNLWHLTFSDESRFSHLLSIRHATRISGHRYTVKTVACHPVLPLMLTSSHHDKGPSDSKSFQSELILWRVDTIGPLCRSGGVSELARIDSSDPVAFTYVEWIPTLLPGFSGGSMSSSSACFLASNGKNLTIYQAVIDSKPLVLSQEDGRGKTDSAGEAVKHELATFRSGLIIPIQTISDAIVPSQDISFMHVFQEQFITGDRQPKLDSESDIRSTAFSGRSLKGMRRAPSLFERNYSAVVDLHNLSSFQEPFYLTIVQQSGGVPSVCMWKIVLSYHSTLSDLGKGSDLSPENTGLSVNTYKFGDFKLPLLAGTEVISVKPAAGHLSSACIYPACFAPYTLVTACSDRTVRFWKYDSEQDKGWAEWNMLSKSKSSKLTISGEILDVSAAYSGRIAVAYQKGHPVKKVVEGEEVRTAEVQVAVYECESSGGSNWMIEDTISLSDVPLSANSLRMIAAGKTPVRNRFRLKSDIVGAPSLNSVHKFERSRKISRIEEIDRSTVMLDWASREDGSHILTVSVGSKILLYAPVSNQVVVAKSQSKPSLVRQQTQTEMIRRGLTWMRLRSVNLKTGDGLPPVPMCVAWVREGIFVACMSNELSIYCQWKQQDSALTAKPTGLVSFESEDERNLLDKDLINIAHETTPGRLPYAPSMNHLPRASSTLALSSSATKKVLLRSPQAKSSPNQSIASDRSMFADYLPDYGLFGASQLASPILPQYHPLQLIELLNSGRIQWVKAILAHLVRCLVGNPTDLALDTSLEDETIQKAFYRNRSLSVSYSEKVDSSVAGQKNQDSEDEVKTIPPLPLWTLLLADEDGSGVENTRAYDELLSSEVDTGRLELDTFDDSSDFGSSPKTRRMRKHSAVEAIKLSDFTPLHAQRLSQLLTKLQLPGLNSSDQMQLLALADTVASCNPDAAEYLTGEQSDGQVIRGTEALDECGLRFLLAMRQYTYLIRCLPPAQRVALKKDGIATYHIAWAFHSDAEEDLVNLIPCMSKGNPTWEELRELGIAWWVRSNTTLRRIIEKVAKTAYQSKQDPLDAALYYLAMGKKTVVTTLYKAAKDVKMTEFWANDFKQDRWRRAALKNAYALLGKQRFLHAAAFFLLAGSLKDAIEVCLDRLEDLQLAVVICRLFEGELDSVPESFIALLKQRVVSQENGNSCKDPFLRSMAYWLMQDYTNSLNTLLEAPNDDDIKLSTDLGSEAAPAVFNYYIFLRSHPLLVRHQTFGSASSDRVKAMISAEKVSFGVGISPLERRLYFTTAHAHFKAGCPVLALEVLSKLPDRLSDGNTGSAEQLGKPKSSGDVTSAVNGGLDKAGDLDWSTPLSSKLGKDSLETAAGLDWSKPSLDLDYDWSKPSFKMDEELKLDWRIESDSEDDEGLSPTPSSTGAGAGAVPDQKEEKQGPLDIMGQQVKFIVCLKILMEEMSTLSTGYEVDGGQLRLQLYVWLEKEVDALKKLCNYGSDASQGSGGEDGLDAHDRSVTPISERPTLQQIMKAEKLDLEARVQSLTRRRQWLRENETLLRTLLSYCSLHGAQGGGLASVRMELILLLQELQQERIGLMLKGESSELNTPLPAPVTVPLIASVAAGTKMFTTDPIRHLQLMVSDMLQSLVGLRTPPHPGRSAPLRQMCLLRDLAIALSACVYQGLCGMEGLNTTTQGNSSFDAVKVLTTAYRDFQLIGLSGKKRTVSGDDNLTPTTPPPKWPGVEYLRAILYKETDQNPQFLLTLLCECFVGVYVSLLSYALVACDNHMLFRLVAMNPTEETFGRVFGGGTKKTVRVSTSGGTSFQSNSSPENIQGSPLSSQRVRLHMRILGENTTDPVTSSPKMRPPRPLPPRPYLPGQSEEIPTFKEVFVPPATSLVACMMAKPKLPLEISQIDYDSSASDVEDDLEPFYDESDEELEDKKKKSKRKANTEFSDTNSISWSIIRVAAVRLASLHVEKFLKVAGTEVQDLPSVSPPLHAMCRTLAKWQEWFYDRYTALGPPPSSYMAQCVVENTFDFQGPPISKYRSLLDAANTPFESKVETKAIRRLWSYLVRQESVQEMFIRLVFGSRRRAAALSFCESASVISDSDIDEIETMTKANKNILAVRILQKEQESISAFAINKVNPGLVSLACGNEIQELDISQILDATKPYDDECNLDLLALDRDLDILPTPNYLLVQTPNDKPFLESVETGIGLNHSGSSSSIYSPSHAYGNQGNKTVTVTKRHKVENVRRLCPHPSLPIYLAGCSDGCVQLWEWGHSGILNTPRPPGTFAKVHRLRFSSHGNKFGVADGDGNVSLWQLKLTAPPVKPYYTYQCHNKSVSDFHFLGSSSVIVTAGLGSDGKNVALWDTLQPQRKAQIHGFVCHDTGATCILYSPQHQSLISAGKKGEVCIWDIRQRSLRQRVTAHENNAAVRAMAMDPGEEYYATGSSEGDIKIWNIENQEMLLALPGEHSRPGFFRPMNSSNQGVNLLGIDAEGRLYSCGSDGSFKFRCLPYKDWTATGR